MYFLNLYCIFNSIPFNIVSLLEYPYRGGAVHKANKQEINKQTAYSHFWLCPPNYQGKYQTWLLTDCPSNVLLLQKTLSLGLLLES